MNKSGFFKGQSTDQECWSWTWSTLDHFQVFCITVAWLDFRMARNHLCPIKIVHQLQLCGNISSYYRCINFGSWAANPQITKVIRISLKSSHVSSVKDSAMHQDGWFTNRIFIVSWLSRSKCISLMSKIHDRESENVDDNFMSCCNGFATLLYGITDLFINLLSKYIRPPNSNTGDSRWT